MSLGHIALLLALTVFTVTLGEPLVYKDCGAEKGKLLTVDVSPCPKQPCPLVKGSSYTINVTFASGEASPTCKAVVYGYLLGVPIPFPLPESDGCKSGIACPLNEGTTYTYITKLPIKAEYPDMKLVVQWELRDADGKNLFCWKIPVQIVDG
ncbi:NPC intracellular cholesterol transporter 2 [Rana temporaria]|uniref:NPC intracellular cholesterol transporter 2 n=1 Tax=Rana temporaria TaxID=8407 RepID=UPI001AACDA69|nr:NPC intracellular cholesterol transporter 2 [Rana temporaria]